MKFTVTQTGIFLMVVGFLVFLNSIGFGLGFLGQTLNAIFIIVSVLMMAKGFIMLEGPEYVKNLFNKVQK